jgi:5-methylcytosine-specific restriction protein A
MGKKKQSRREFIDSIGATCRNWQWSWSFVNHDKRFVVFGAWDVNTMGRRCLILSGKWEFKSTGRKTAGYPQSREHIRLVAEDGYALKTFPMEWSNARQDEDGVGPPVIGGFTPKLSVRGLLPIGNDWYATDLDNENAETGLTEELEQPERYPEGARKQVYVNAIERSGKARDACIRHHGLNCVVCGFNFQVVYGEIGEGFIHVHHLVPVGALRGERLVDPAQDLVPVCPNCHAMIHQVTPPLDVDQLRGLLRKPEQP